MFLRISNACISHIPHHNLVGSVQSSSCPGDYQTCTPWL